jgi:hypothetical protein
VESESRILVDELRALHVECSQTRAQYFSTFRRIVLPVEDDAFGLALSRTYLHPTIIDDACEDNQVEAFRALGIGMMKCIVAPAHHVAVADSLLNPNSTFIAYMFNRIAEYCESVF